MSHHDVDLFVIGGGSGGVRAARIAAGYGAKVMLAEESRVGGTCVIRGCVPKKLYVLASRFGDEMEDAAGFGWDLQPPAFDFSILKVQKDREIERLEKAYRANLQRSNVEIVDSRAELVGPHTVALISQNNHISAKHILIATGARPHMPDEIEGIVQAESSDDFFNWDHLPRSVVIVGAGYIGVEFACLLQRLGVKVTLVIRRDKVLPRFDEDVRTALTDAMRQQGIEMKTMTSVARIAGERGRLVVGLHDGSSIACERIVFATGRLPNVKGLGLEKAGVQTGKNGAICVDADSATNIPSIHAVGDVTDRVALTPVAIREGHAFADTYFGNKPARASHDMIATAVFSTPEVGTVGLTESEARARYSNVVIYRTDFRPMKATLSGRTDRVLMKLVVDGDTDRMLGVHILGEASGEMIQCLGIAMRMGATKQDFDMTMAVHPTAAEELVTMRTPYNPH
jgi:glutathione reductase (NADPH)